MSFCTQWFVENKKEILSYFDMLHAMPEPSFKEYNTSHFLANELHKYGYTVLTGFAQTAVLGILDTGRSGPIVCLRADMDALTFTIDGEVQCIHACGHDANCTEVLAAARMISETKLLTRGVLKVLFQPCEEGMQGALEVIQSGALQRVDYMFGTHLRPSSELVSGASPSILHGTMAIAHLAIHGKSAHGARPSEGINAVAVGSMVINEVASLRLPSSTPYSIKPTSFQTAACAVNVIPAETEVVFDLRAQNNQCMSLLKEALETIVNEICSQTGAISELSYKGQIPAAKPSDEAITVAERAIRKTYGDDLCHPPVVTVGSEDFHFYTQNLPGLYASVLGFGAEMKAGLHNPQMTFNHDVLPKATQVLAAIVDIIINGNGRGNSNE